MEGNINSMAVTSIDYRLLDSLYAPSTLRDPSACRSIPILAARRLDPSNLVELDAVVGSIHSITPPAALLMPVWLPREVSVILLLSGPLSSVLVIVGRKVVRRQKRACVVFELSSATRRLLEADMLPTSTASLDQRPQPSAIVNVPMGSANGPVAPSVSSEDTSFIHRIAVIVGSSLAS
ncbi:hypothetical protein THAOC_12008 [Thalassiosira oceanica]|uniref:Uncharacterized protein n=1 Tax=Thalassiosira oceanica TaxID=159749 RepID=K0SNR1_THAOC|nr:hypothetical protein THAOC_12008 [Thalassiosira oceanica]|eukprot:EJK67010.1 hypothetical protein THAOC_12008 [Thalassiosira oceanica]